MSKRKARKKKSGKSIRLNKEPEVLGAKRFAAISAVEGLKLSAQGRRRVVNPLSTTKRREGIIRAYLVLKASR